MGHAQARHTRNALSAQRLIGSRPQIIPQGARINMEELKLISPVTNFKWAFHPLLITSLEIQQIPQRLQAEDSHRRCIPAPEGALCEW